MINFDNAATTFPKPSSVEDAAVTALRKYGGNPGRSGHTLSLDTAKAVYDVRNACAEFFEANAENVIFTLNCTHALNLAIKGIMTPGDHIIASGIEHNSVARPVFALSAHGCTYDLARVSSDDNETASNFEALIRSNTKAIVCTAASNVSGQLLPYRQLGALCRKHGICFIVDGAQACGILPIALSDGINILCTAGHKGLYGPAGTGLLITDGKFPLDTIMEGGTGSSSLELAQPDFLPDQLESGTINTVGVIGLGAGLRFVQSKSMDRIFKHEEGLCGQLIQGIQKLPGMHIYRQDGVSYVPIVSFNLDGYSANELAQLLSDKGFALRGGLHCAPLAHHTLGTAPEGTVRFAPSAFNHSDQVIFLINTLKKLVKS